MGEVLSVKRSPNCYCEVEGRGRGKRYCGRCGRCGRPGHTRHFPGAVPYTGSWCTWHYYRAMIFHPLGTVGTPLYCGTVFLGLLYVLW